MSTLTVVGVLFLLSLLGAVVLFKFFKSSAIVTGKTYQAGGAIAGFIILYGILYSSYSYIEKSNYQKINKEYEEFKKKLVAQKITGRINPYRENTKIVLAVRETDPDSNGKFRLKAPCLDPEVDDIRVYVITEKEHEFVNIFSEEEMTGLDIPLKSAVDNIQKGG